MQKDWNELGPEAFTFETLDQLEQSKDAGYTPSKDLSVHVQMWIDKLKASGEPMYKWLKNGPLIHVIFADSR